MLRIRSAPSRRLLQRAFRTGLALTCSLPQLASSAEWPTLGKFLERHCYECHDSDTAKADLDLETLPRNLEYGDRGGVWT